MLSLTARKSNINLQIFLAILAVAFGYIAGFRTFGTGMDFINYEFFYSDIKTYDDISYFRFEPGYVISAIISKLAFGFDYRTFAAVLMSISLWLKFRALGRLTHPVMAVVFYLAAWYPVHEHTQVRIAFAITLLFLASEQMFQGKWLRFVALSILATTFHMTAALGAIVLASANILARYNLRYGILAVCLGGVVISVFIVSFIRFSNGLNSLIEGSTLDATRPNIFSGTNVVTALFLLCYVASDSLKEHRNRTFFLVVCAGFSVYFAFFSVPVMAHRLKELLMVFMTFIAFEYRMSIKNLPLAVLAVTLAGGSLYSAISMGLFSD